MGEASLKAAVRAREERIADLQRLIAARSSIPGYRANVERLKAELAALTGG